MATFLDALAARAAGQAPLLTVRARARFEPAAEAAVPLTSDLSDLSDPSAAPRPEPLPSSPVGEGRASERIVPERNARRTGVARPVVPEPAVTAPFVTESDVTEPDVADRMFTVPVGADAVGVDPAPTSPFRARATGKGDRQDDRLSNPQTGIDRQVRAPTVALGDAPENSTLPPELLAPQTDQPTHPSTVRTTARQPLRSPAPMALATGPDPVRATRGRPAVSVPPPQQLLSEHLVPALARAGLISPDGTDVVRWDPALETGDGWETVGATRVPEVHVHIDRVEVTQAPPATSPNQPARPPAPAPPPRTRSRLPAVDHDGHLARRRQGDRDAR